MITKFTIQGKLLERFPHNKGPFCFQPGLNLLVGANGSGKSTLLRAIRDALAKPSPDLILEQSDTVTPHYWSSEEDGIRNLSHFRDDLYDMIDQVSAMYASRGEAQSGYFAKWLVARRMDVMKGKCLLLMDEPDVTLDMILLEVLIKNLRSFPKQSQAIIAVHHPLIALQPANVIELTPNYLSTMKSQIQAILDNKSDF